MRTLLLILCIMNGLSGSDKPSYSFTGPSIDLEALFEEDPELYKLFKELSEEDKEAFVQLLVEASRIFAAVVDSLATETTP